MEGIGPDKLTAFKSLIEKFKSTEPEAGSNKSIRFEEGSSKSKNKHTPKAEQKKGNKKLKVEGILSPELVPQLPLLKDFIKEGLDILFVGINPGIQSSLKGHHYANPTNIFWPSLYESNLIDKKLTCCDEEVLLNKYNFGLTNLCERPTKSSSDLSVKEQRDSVKALSDKILKFKPKIVSFEGKGIYLIFKNTKNCNLGLQNNYCDKREPYYFVMVSTSGRAASYKKEDKVNMFRDLKQVLDSVKEGKIPSQID